MEIRVKLLWRLLCLLLIVVGTIRFIEKFVQGESFTIREIFILVTFPLLVYAFVFMALTMRVILSRQGIKVYWKVGMGSLKVWEQNNYYLSWQDVVNVYSQLPTWLPFHAIGVIGQQKKKVRMFYLGLIMAKKKESLIYFADHLSPEIIDEDVQELIEKYRQQLQKRSDTVSPT